MKKKTKQLTVYDIARKAGCSHSTVAAVLGGRAEQIRISPPTVRRIEILARKMGYRPNALARWARTGRSGVIAVVVRSVTQEYVGRVLAGVLEALYDRGRYTIKIMCSEFGADLGTLLDQCLEYRVDGVFCCDLGRIDDATKIVRGDPGRRRLRIVHSNCCQGFPGLRIDPDDRSGTAMAVEFLASLGHRRIGFVGGPQDQVLAVDNRREGYEAAMHKLDLPLPEGIMHPASWSTEAKAEVLWRILSQKTRPTALVTAQDDTAASAIQVATRLGIKVPEQLSLVGFSDIELARFTVPTLTTIAQPHVEIGRKGMAALLERAASDNGDGSDFDGAILLPVKLVVRESTAPAPVEVR